MDDWSAFDRWAEEHGYGEGDAAQAFADWLASLTGERVVGVSEEGVVESRQLE